VSHRRVDVAATLMLNCAYSTESRHFDIFSISPTLLWICILDPYSCFWVITRYVLQRYFGTVHAKPLSWH